MERLTSFTFTVHYHLYIAYIYIHVHTGISAYKGHQLQQNPEDGWAEILQSCQWLWMPLCPYTLGQVFICSDKTQLQMKPVKSVADKHYCKSSFWGAKN